MIYQNFQLLAGVFFYDLDLPLSLLGVLFPFWFFRDFCKFFRRFLKQLAHLARKFCHTSSGKDI
jgi:hypothetical protein